MHHDDQKSIQEVAFEWLWYSGGFEDLRKQCKNYNSDKAVYRFVLCVDIMMMLEFNAKLGNMAIYQPRNVISILQEVSFTTIATLSWISFLVSPSQLLLVVRFRSLPSPLCCQLSNRRETLASSEHPGLFQVTGIVCGLTPVKQYTQSARFLCPLPSCAGSSKYCYIRVHIPGKSERVTVRNDFLCRYCGCKLLEDVTCRTLAERCTVQIISVSALHHELWTGAQKSRQGTRYQAMTVYVRDELVKRVEVGGLFSFVIMSSREIHENLDQYHCIPIFEANNLNKVYPQMRLNKIPTAMPSTITLLYEDRRSSPWSFAASLAYSFGACAAPPGTYFHLKLGLLLSLMLLNGRDGQQKAEEGAVSLERLHVLAVGYDVPRLQRLLKYSASFAERMIVHSPGSELFASTSRDPFGSGTCIINAGCLLLASDGICIVPNVAMMKKEAREKLQHTMENAAVALEIPEKYREHQEEKLSLPFKSTVWACADAQSGKMDFSVAPQSTLESRTLTRAFMDRFALVFGPPTESTQSDCCDDLCVDEVLSRALKNDQEQKPDCYINDQEMGQFLNYASGGSVQFTKTAHELIQRYYLASRRAQNAGGQGKEFPLSSLRVLTRLTAAHAKLSLRNEVAEEDAVAAIWLYEETLQRWLGFSGVLFDRHGFPNASGPSIFFGPENDLRMEQYHSALAQFCSVYANSKTFLGSFDDE